jgi:thiol-disulfide isomerase/thioredoxin
MMKSVIHSVSIVLLCLLLAPIALTAQQSSARKAPELAFHVPGHGEELLSQFRGKVILLEFIETTCPHCQASTKVMTKLQSEYGSRGFQVLQVSVNALQVGGGTPQGADQVVSEFARQFGTNFPVGWISMSEMQAFMGWAGGRFVVPQLLLLDRRGYIRLQTPQLGGGDYEQIVNEQFLEQHIKELLGASGRGA